MRLRNVVASTPIVCEKNRKLFADLILEVCVFRFRQFSGSDEHIFQQISTKSHVGLHIKFGNADFVLNGE